MLFYLVQKHIFSPYESYSIYANSLRQSIINDTAKTLLNSMNALYPLKEALTTRSSSINFLTVTQQLRTKKRFPFILHQTFTS